MKDSLSLEVYRVLRHTFNSLKKELRNKLGENGISWPQFHALYHIDEQGVPVNELARELNCNASNMTGLIDRMMENRWVYREHSESDRRVWLVKLTEEGMKVKARLIPEHHQNIRERMNVLNEEELIALKSLLEKLLDGSMKENGT